MVILRPMKFFKVLVNSLLSCLLFGVLLALLFADLNINLKITPSLFVQLTLRLMAVYGILVLGVCLLAFFIIQFFSGRKIKIAFVSPSFLLLSSSLLVFLFLLLFRANVNYFSSFFDSQLKAELQAQGVVLFSLAVLALIIFFLFRHHRWRIFFFLTYFSLFLLSFGILIGRRCQASAPSPPTKSLPLFGKKVDRKITLIGMPGLSFDWLIPLTAEGKLPNFSWLFDNGSSGRLRSFTPAESITLDNSLQSGKFPAKHRQVSRFQYQLWKMKDRLEIIPRFMLFKQLARVGCLEILAGHSHSVTTDIWQILEANRIPFVRKEWPSSSEPLASPSARAEKLWTEILGSSTPPADAYLAIAKDAFVRDCIAEEQAAGEKNALQPSFYYLQLGGFNIVLTYFYKFRFPEQFGSMDQEQVDHYGPLIDRYYGFYDQVIGKSLTGLKEDELLVVFSPHGIEPLPLWKRAIESLLGNPMVSAHHEFAPDGVIFFYGKNVERGKNLEGMRLVDLAPTLLYYLGLPVGRDMDGIARTDIFERDFIANNPIIYISSYDEIKIIPPR